MLPALLHCRETLGVEYTSLLEKCTINMNKLTDLSFLLCANIHQV